MSDPTVYAAIELLQNRIAALESQVCRCLSCTQRDLEAARVATVQKYAAITNCIDRDKRNAMIADLSPKEQIVYLSQHVSDPAIVLDAPDEQTRDEWLQRVQPGVAMRVRLALLERAGRLPRTCRVSMVGSRTWQRHEFEIDAKTSKVVRNVLPDRTGPHSLAHNVTVFRPFSFAHVGETLRIPVEAVEVVKAVDAKFREAVDANHIQIETCSVEDDRTLQMNLWSER